MGTDVTGAAYRDPHQLGIWEPTHLADGEVLMTWVIVTLLVVAVLAVAAVLIEQRRAATLRNRFGSEYDRIVEQTGDRREARAELRDRIKRRKSLDIRELTPAEQEAYVERWRAVQFGFVDEPRRAVVAASALVDEVMDDRGYRAVPESDGDTDGRTGVGPADRLDLVAVDHPQLAADYRAARTTGAGTIDDQRVAFVRYRALFEALVSNGADAGASVRTA
jgi:hypothetical protein